MNGFTNATPNGISAKDEWITPQWITDALGPFDLDPCAPCVPPWKIAARHLCICDNGLAERWPDDSFVWCNPPYGKQTFVWLEKLANHSGGGIALIFARTDTKGFHRSVLAKADSIFLFRGRLKFHHVDGVSGEAAPAPSCLVAYGKEATTRLHYLKEHGVLLDIGEYRQ